VGGLEKKKHREKKKILARKGVPCDVPKALGKGKNSFLAGDRKREPKKGEGGGRKQDLAEEAIPREIGRGTAR